MRFPSGLFLRCWYPLSNANPFRSSPGCNRLKVCEFVYPLLHLVQPIGSIAMARFPEFDIEDCEPSRPRYALTSSDFDLYSETFELCDREGGGHDWQSVAEYLLRTKLRKCAKTISFDSEASMFCALSDRQSALEQLADLLCHTFRSKQRLSEAVRKSGNEEEGTRSTKNQFSSVVVIHFDYYLYEEQELLVGLLESKLTSRHVLVYSPMGCGESTLYVRTNEPEDAIRSLKPLLKELDLLKTAVLAIAPAGSEKYNVVWPRKRKKPLVPENELCPTIK